MLIEIPDYLRDKSKLIDFQMDNDGAYDLKLIIEIDGQNDFIPLLSYRKPTTAERCEKEWLDNFKKRHNKLWDNGYDLTSKLTNEGTIYGCTKNGEYIDLELYKSNTQNFCVTPNIVKVKSLDLKTEFDVFNSFLYGYDAIISDVQNHLPVKFKKKCKCRVCGNNTYKVYINIHSTGAKDLLEQQECEKITKENWMNAFDFISINLECANCGKQIKRWFEMETM